MQEFLYSISQCLLAVNIVSLLIGALMLPRRSAFVPTLFIVLCIQIFQTWYEWYLLEKLAKTLTVENIRTMWYMGFAVVDFLAIFIAVNYCRLAGSSRDRPSNIILINIAVLGLVQIVRYIDRVLIGTDVLGDIYSLSIPTLNLGVSIVASGYVLGICFTAFINTKINYKGKGN